ncbi:hypothetical protein ACFL7D_03710 [candidate division KSB1 bacterium]
MIRSKVNILIVSIVLTAVLTVIFPGKSWSQLLNWRSFTPMGNVKDLIYSSGRLWGVTEGGVFSYHIGQNYFEIFNNTNGLSSNNTSSFVLDGSGGLWIGLDDGSLNIIDTENFTTRRIIIDTDPVKINDLGVADNTLFLALDVGIAHFNVSKEEIKSTYRNLGDFAINTEVLCLYVDGDNIWGGTVKGAVSASLSSPNLQDPQFWENYTVQDGLLSNNILNFISSGDTVFVATEKGISKILNGAVSYEAFSGIKVNALKKIDGLIYTAADNSVYIRKAPGDWEKIGPDITGTQTLIYDNNDNLWAGHKKDGLFVLDESKPEWINIEVPGPGGFPFAEMTIDKNGILWAATGQTGNNGIYVFDGLSWDHLTYSDGIFNTNTTGIEVDNSGKVWIGTPGSGVILIEKTESSYLVSMLDSLGTILSGADTPGFVIVNKIKRDRYGNMWLLNRFAGNGKAIAVMNPDYEWFYFSVSDGLVSNAVTDITFDRFDKVWIGTDNNGVSRLNYNGTLGEKLDDTWENFTTQNNLNSNRITSLAADREFGVWIGTQEGINYIVDGLPVQDIRGVIDNFVYSVSVDPANNKWFGTKNGLSILLSDNFTWEHYTQENSGLVRNSINSIYIDPQSGKAYIGTGSGLSLLETPYVIPSETFSGISVYPSPFELDGSGNILTIENLPLQSTVRIFTFYGKLVRELNNTNNGVIGSRAYWNGTDEKGYPVSTGIYFVAAALNGTGHGVQKITVIRK